MSKTLKVHSLWLGISILSFVIGYSIFPSNTQNKNSSKKNGLQSSSLLEESGDKSPRGLTDGKVLAENVLKEDSQSNTNQLSDLDIESIGAQLRGSTNPIDRRLAFSKLLEGLTAENALLIRDQIKSFDPNSAEFKEFHYAWGAVGGTDAIMFGVDTVEPDMQPALSGWASSDPQKAIEWFEALDMENDSSFDPLLKDRKMKAEDLKNHLLGGLVQGLSNSDPDLAIDYVKEVIDSGNRVGYRLMHAPISAMIQTNSPSEAAQWAAQLDEGEIRNQAMSRTADNYAKKDFEAAKEWAESFGSDNGVERVIDPVTRNWASKDPEAALEWVSTLPEGNAQHSGTSAALHQWAEKDPTAASNYLAEMPESDMRNAAIAGFSNRLVWENPQAAMTWASSISGNDQFRNEVMARVGRSWQRKDPKGAAQWSADNPGIIQERK
ncbi:MAG: hypothetical protein ACPHOG_11700 [Verrucomicrobiales bacterium]